MLTCVRCCGSRVQVLRSQKRAGGGRVGGNGNTDKEKQTGINRTGMNSSIFYRT